MASIGPGFRAIETRETPVETPVRFGARGVIGAKEVLNRGVIDSHGERIGILSDIMFDHRSGRVAFGIVTLDRAPHWTERVIAVPWNAMHLSSDEQTLCVNARRDWIERAPSIRADGMPCLLDHDCAVLIHSFFGTRPYWESGSQQHS